MKQTTKNIESHFIKIHLCGMFVYGIGMCTGVWIYLKIDTHHKYYSNQVVNAVMHVINGFRQMKGRLRSPILQIQADNCTQENKNL